MNWFKFKGNITPSIAEQKLSSVLNKLKIKYISEVCIEGFKYPSGQYGRFDFYLPEYDILLEYDGNKFHTRKDVKTRDELKNSFCRDNKIPLIRYNKTHYNNFEEYLKILINDPIIKKRFKPSHRAPNLHKSPSSQKIARKSMHSFDKKRLERMKKMKTKTKRFTRQPTN